ncbi:unnamed protein product [Acanthoscelides obtectus]|uniref:Uncharacterized protein n=1 Tax=Acanthoscelides obtectus TaxID=200917 RepID=A0A9P0PTI2_ACAOB|nr:unnamed protein product [Acanthoscelides obtectus]CAK1635479.1 hypothetical protein AOBTE_LOCUS9297 [Acanthoscelides obtectus]
MKLYQILNRKPFEDLGKLQQSYFHLVNFQAHVL